MNGFFVYNTVLCGIGSGPLVWCRVAAWVMRSTQAWLTSEMARTNCFVDDPIILVVGSKTQRNKAVTGVLLLWCSFGLKLDYEKGLYGPEACLDWHATERDFRLPAKNNSEIFEALQCLMDSLGGMVRHDEVRNPRRRRVGWPAFLPQLKPFVRQ